MNERKRTYLKQIRMGMLEREQHYVFYNFFVNAALGALISPNAIVVG